MTSQKMGLFILALVHFLGSLLLDAREKVKSNGRCVVKTLKKHQIFTTDY
jgi:hypothetical protein